MGGTTLRVEGNWKRVNFWMDKWDKGSFMCGSFSVFLNCHQKNT